MTPSETQRLEQHDLFFQTPRDFSQAIRFFLKMAYSTAGETMVYYYYYF